VRIAAATPLADILEADWQRQVVQVARMVGFNEIYHTFNSRKSAHGFPDLILLRERLIALELKREKTGLTDPQRQWIRALTKAGVEVYIARPRHLEQLGLILAARTVFTAPDDDLIPYRLSTDAARAARQQLVEELRKELGE